MPDLKSTQGINNPEQTAIYIKHLYEQHALLWQQACRIESIDPHQNGFQFSIINIAAQKYQKVVREYLKYQNTFKLLTGHYWKPLKEKKDEDRETI